MSHLGCEYGQHHSAEPWIFQSYDDSIPDWVLSGKQTESKVPLQVPDLHFSVTQRIGNGKEDAVSQMMASTTQPKHGFSNTTMTGWEPVWQAGRKQTPFATPARSTNVNLMVSTTQPKHDLSSTKMTAFWTEYCLLAIQNPKQSPFAAPASNKSY